MDIPNPTPNCNYLLDERIMFGWYPCYTSTGPLSNNVKDILKTGRNVFVNLTSIKERSELYNYIPDVLNVVEAPIFINYPIKDVGLPLDIDSYIKLIDLLHLLVVRGDKLYIHCRGGHGRSGIVAACLLIHMGYSNQEALDLVSKAHKTRSYIPDYPCPQTEEQAQFVRQYKKK